MKPICRQLAVGLVAVLLVVTHTAMASAQSTPEGFSCPVSTPGKERPAKHVDPFAIDDLLIHEDGIWVSIPANGVLRLRPDDAIKFGPLTGWRSTEVQWLRDDGIEGFVIVSGQRLDEQSDLSPQTPLSPQRQYVLLGPVKTGLAFPSEGCWEVTGRVGEHSITWMVEVRFEDEVATPEA